VTLLSTGDITTLNSGVSGAYTAYNNVPTSLTSMGFAYYDSDAKLVMNTKFGSMKIVKQQAKDFEIQYTVAKGQVWSDGTPIDAVDLLLSHVITANKYSASAGLGDPSSADATPAFNSEFYSQSYASHVVGLPTLSADHMSLTVKFDKPLPDWQLLAPGASPVHALELLADGKKTLGAAAANLKAKAQFLSDFTKKNTTRLKKMGAVWSKGYAVTKVDSTTNPLLLISNGGFIVSKFNAGQSMTLVRNPKYTSGPAMKTTNPIKTVVIKIIKDNTAAVQALRNGDIDVYYNTLPSSADKSSLSAMTNVTTLTKTGGNYSHLHLRTDSALGETDSYTGPFAGNGQKAKDLRHAFLLAVPRGQLVDTIVKPVKSDATTLDTEFAFQGTPEYSTITKGSGVSEFSAGTQASRTAKALALVQKYYPTASKDDAAVTIHFAHADTPTRNALEKLIAAEVKNAGFEIVDHPFADLFGEKGNKSAKYDVTMYGFGLDSLSQSNGTGIYKSDSKTNVWGWNNSALDAILNSLQGDALTPSQVTAKRLAADKIVISNYLGLPLYANPTITAFNKAVKNIKPAPVGNNITWNFFEWSY
jgi:peptide/nickel transport system substrate-binding protein